MRDQYVWLQRTRAQVADGVDDEEAKTGGVEPVQRIPLALKHVDRHGRLQVRLGVDDVDQTFVDGAGADLEHDGPTR